MRTHVLVDPAMSVFRFRMMQVAGCMTPMLRSDVVWADWRLVCGAFQEMVRVRVGGDGRIKRSGGRDLKQSQAYPPQFGQAHVVP